MSLQVKRSRMTSQGASRPRYPSGDPGLLGGLLGGIGGFLTGGPVGAVAGAIGGFKGGGSQPQPQRTGFPAPPGFGGPMPVRPTPGLGGAVQRLLPGGRTGYEVQPMAQGGKAPSGYHWNKSDYWLKDGTFVPKGTKLVKNRTRNAMNSKALNRALSRVNMAKRWQSKLSEITTGKYTAAGKKKNC